MPSTSVLVDDSLEKRLQSNVAKYNITQCNLCCVILCQGVMHSGETLSSYFVLNVRVKPRRTHQIVNIT